MLLKILFWFSLSLIIYAYLGYPLILLMISKFQKLSYKRDEFHPTVSVIIAIYNGERVVKEKLENTLSLNYPKEKLEVIVASDCSIDKTHEIVKEYQEKGVRLVVSPERQGKTVAENVAIKKANGDFLIFTDSSTLLEKNAVNEMVKNFVDSRVGCVSGKDQGGNQHNPRLTASEGLYVRYEMVLRGLESLMSSLVGASGCLYSVRRELCVEIPAHITRDFFTPLYAKEKGFITVHEPRAIVYVKAVDSQLAEFRRRIRTITGGLSVLFYKRALLNPIRYGSYAIVLLHHKLLRWLVPFFLLICLSTNLLLSQTSTMYFWFLMIQIMFYILGGFGFIQNRVGRLSWIFSILSYFIMINVATLISWWNLLTNQDKGYAIWDPTQR